MGWWAFPIALPITLVLAACQAPPSIGAHCERASECPAPLVCAVGHCRAECVTSRDCPIGARCLADPNTRVGACSLVDVDGCGGGGACSAGFVCLDAQCVNACGAIVRCPDGVCRDDACIPVRDPVDASIDVGVSDADRTDAFSADAAGGANDAGVDDASADDASVGIDASSGLDAWAAVDAASSDAGADAPAMSCDGGFHVCGGSCVPDDASACGPACAICTATGGVPRCVFSSCSVDCGALGAMDDAAWLRSGPTTCLWNAPALASLTSSVGALAPTLVAGTFAYTLGVPLAAASIVLTPIHTAPLAAEASITIDGIAVASGAAWMSATLPLGASTHRVVVTAEGGASVTYTITIVRGFAAGHYLKAGRPGMIDQFGNAVAIDGDTIVVGAPYEDSNATTVDGDPTNDAATDAGAAYVFVRSGGTWVQQAYLKASNAEAGDFFGSAVAVSGDTIVVGAPSEDSPATGVNGTTGNGASASGAAYVFVRNTSGVWSQQAYLKASNTDAGDSFGRSVAISIDTIVVGADAEASAATGVGGSQLSNMRANAGAAYVFLRSAGAWSQQAYLKASNTDAGDSFGWSVSVSGDTAVVGADNEASAARTIDGNAASNTAASAGAAYVFVRNVSGVWSQQAYLKASNTDASDFFGSSVSVSGNTIVVGAPGEDGGGTGVTTADLANAVSGCGAAYVFTRVGSAWSQVAYLKPTVARSTIAFGVSASISGDLVVIGATREDSGSTGVLGSPADIGAPDAGAAYAFARDAGGTWSAVAYLKASNTGTLDNLGYAVSISGTSIVACSPYEDGSSPGVDGPSNEAANGAGACYTFEG